MPAGERVVAGIVARLAVVYGASMKPDQLELLTAVWTEELAEYPADLLTAAYHHIVRTHKDGWFPKPAQMIEHMTDARAGRLADLRAGQGPQRARMVEPPKPTAEERERVLALIAQTKANLTAPPRGAYRPPAREMASSRIPLAQSPSNAPAGTPDALTGEPQDYAEWSQA